MNTYFEKPDEKKATYRHVWTQGLQGPWTTDRYSELDLCLASARWSNSILDIESDKGTNINTDHLALVIKVKQR